MNEQPTIEQRLAALEQRVAKLERKPRPRRKSRRRDMIALDRFAAMHNVAMIDVTRAINMQVLKPDEIEQKDGNVVLMLDSEGRRAFWESLHDAGTWRDCPICPHELF